MHLTTKFHNLTFNRWEVIVETNWQTNKQAGWFLRPDCAPSSECPQFGSTEWCGATLLDLHICHRLPPHAATPPQYWPLDATIGGRLPEWQTSKCISSVSFVPIESIFYNTQEAQTQKMMDQNFEIRILWFLRIFWNFQKGVMLSLCGRSGPLWSRPN